VSNAEDALLGFSTQAEFQRDNYRYAKLYIRSARL